MSSIKYKTMDHLFRQRRISVPKRTSEFVALIAVSCTLFLFLHTRDLSTKLDRLQRQTDDVTAFNHLTDKMPTDRTDSGSASFSPQENRDNSRRGNNIETGPSETMGEEELDEEQGYIPQPWEVNNTMRSSGHLLFFNRVPKVGSQTFMEMIRRLSIRNNFHFNRDVVQRVETIRLNLQDQEQLVRDVSSYTPPGSYTKHVCYTNFTKFGYPEPVYINMVRDPVERIISWYYYVRAPWYYVERKRAFPDLPLPDPMWLKKDFESCVLSGDRECQYVEGETHDGVGDHRRQTLFFCGHEAECMPFDGVEAMQRAKRNVEEQYAVVGILEDINSTLLALEHYVPRYFEGATQLYWEQQNTFNRINRNNFKPPVSESIKEMVRKNFTHEIEFYEFCKQRLYTQLKALRDPAIKLPKKTRRRSRRAIYSRL